MGVERPQEEGMLNEIPTDPLMKGLIKAWFMVPLSNSSMRLGAMNEGNVRFAQMGKAM